VTTPDLQRAIEAATGRNIDWLFDEFVYRGGHPAFKLAFEWDEEGKRAKLNVAQTQDEKESSVFRLPVTVDFTVDGKKHSFDVEIAEKVHNFYFALPGKPQMVRFDPGHNYLKSVEFKPGKDMLLHQLKHDDDVVGRIDAAKELAKLGSRPAIDALKDAVLNDAFWGVQNEAARALGTVKSQYALDALLACVRVRHPKARRGVVNALGQFRNDERAAAALEAVLRKGDASYYVEAAAANALGQTRVSSAFNVLANVAMKRESFNDVVRSAALLGLAELKDERALPIAIEWTKRGKSNPVRGMATTALGRIGRVSDQAKDRAYDRLIELLPDEWLRVRLNAVAALAELKEPKAVGELTRTIDRDLDGRVIRASREAINRIREGADKGEEVRKLREDVDKLADENRTLRDRVDKMEAATGASRGGVKAKPRGTGARAGGRRAAAAKKVARTRAAARTPVRSSNGARPAGARKSRVAASRARRI
jgi:aminopeptidase N